MTVRCFGRALMGVWALMGTLGCGGGSSHPAATGETGTGGTGMSDTTNGAGQVGAAAADKGGQGPCGPVDSTLADADAADLFAFEKVPTFDLYLPAESWTALQKNAREEQYVEAQACFEGRSVGRIAMRFKGSYGSLYGCFDEAGNNTCRKLGIKLKFDEYVTDQRFHGLKRLYLQGNRYDDSYLHEKLAYDTYRAMDIPAPRAAWAIVRVNDELQGLFGMVEAIDGRFSSDRWPDHGNGNLYKEAWPIHPDAQYAIDHLETNEEEAKVESFVAFSEAMDAAADKDLRTTLGQHMDLDALARYMAVDDAIANYDGITAYYTSEDAEWAGNHNFFLYEDEAAPGQFTIIPWDLESTFTTNSGFGNVPRWTTVPDDCGQNYGAWGGSNLVIAPGCDRVFRAMAADLEGYRAAGQQLLDGPFAQQTLLSTIEQHTEFIRAAAESDPNGPGKVDWETAVAMLRDEIPKLRARFEYLLTGKSWVALEIDVTQIADFEDQDDFGLTMGPSLYCNPNSTVSVAVNTTEPLAGAQDLVLSFEYANQPDDDWGQWTQFTIPLTSGSNDLTSFTGVRMWLKADQARTLRLDIESPNNSAREQGVRLGWDVPVGQTANQVDVKLAEAAVPSWAGDQGLDPGDNLADIVSAASGLVFHPQCAGRANDGQLPDGTTDPGFLEIDDIEFYQ
ncbi:MAG: CotH kinase family protein [Polyangiaceae bacterium]|nr:CotH kinase family protein [Polyangiaceae bacterium]